MYASIAYCLYFYSDRFSSVTLIVDFRIVRHLHWLAV